MPNRILDGRGHPLQRKGLYMPGVGILITLMVAFIYYQLGDRPWIDRLSALTICVAYLTASFVIASFTEDWKWRAVGLFVSVFGVGLSYAFLFGVSVSYFSVNTLAVRSALRASLTVGGVILFIGIVGWGVERKRGSKQPLLDALDPREHYG